MASLSGRTALITGASRGIGAAIARAYHREGARVALTATDPAHLEPLVRTLDASGDRVVALELRLESAASCHRAVEAAVERLGPLDVVVNNAGLLGRRGPVLEQPPEEWARVMDANLAGPLRVLRAAVPRMREGGAIINVTSGAAGRPGWAAYSLSKLALDGLTAMLREECAPRNIRCIAVNPGPARTAMRAAAHPDEDPGTVPHPDDLTAVFTAIAAGADPGPLVQAADWMHP